MNLIKPSIVTLSIYYYIPSHAHILNEFYWQLEDQLPHIPRVHKFLNYWKTNNLAKINSIIVSTCDDVNINFTSFYEKL